MTFTKATELLCDRRLPGVFSDLGTRVTLLWCRCDKMVPESSIRELRRIIPGNCYFEHPWGGHHLMEDDPEWVVDRIVECFAVSKSV